MSFLQRYKERHRVKHLSQRLANDAEFLDKVFDGKPELTEEEEHHRRTKWIRMRRDIVRSALTSFNFAFCLYLVGMGFVNDTGGPDIYYKELMTVFLLSFFFLFIWNMTIKGLGYIIDAGYLK